MSSHCSGGVCDWTKKSIPHNNGNEGLWMHLQWQQASLNPCLLMQEQLRLWEHITKHRTLKIHQHCSFFLSSASDITLQLKNSQPSIKDHLTLLKHPQIDGIYTSHLLTTHLQFAYIFVAIHLEAICFSCMDDRLLTKLRQHEFGIWISRWKLRRVQVDEIGASSKEGKVKIF